MTVTELKEILERIEKDGQGQRKLIFSGYDAYTQCADEYEIDDFIYRDKDATIVLY